MKLVRTGVVLAAATLWIGALPAVAVSAPTWRIAHIVALPQGGSSVPDGYLPGFACASAGNCVVAGDYMDAAGTVNGLIANEVDGTWKAPATLAPPSDAASTPQVQPSSASCGSEGNCVVVGSFETGSQDIEPFIGEEVDGKWRGATVASLPPNAVSEHQIAQLHSVVCTSAGNCSAVGTYAIAAGANTRVEGVELTEVAHVWHSSELALPAGTNVDPFANLGQLACSSAGNCVADGEYFDADNATLGVLVSEVAGVWQTGVTLTLPGNASGFADVSLSSIACAAAGNCAAIGTYETAVGDLEGLTVNEVQGHWQRAVEIRMPAGAAASPLVFYYGFAGISCPSAGNCATGGQYRDATGDYEGFLLNEANGVWQTATELQLPVGAEMAGKNGGVVALTCPLAGECSAGAAYVDGYGDYQAYIVSEVDDVWSASTVVALPTGATTVGVDGGVYGVICFAGDRCTASGSYLDAAGDYQGFTLSTG